MLTSSIGGGNMFCDNFRIIRKKSGKTQKEIADFLSISAQSISKWETGESLPTIEYLPQIAKLLGCSINAFFDEEELQRFENDNLRLGQYEKTNDFKDKIEDAFSHFSISAEVVDIYDNGRIVTYKILMHRGVGIRTVLKRADDIRYYIGDSNARFITDGYERKYFAIESSKPVFDNIVLSDDEIREILRPLGYRLPIIIGKDTKGCYITDDLTKLPHIAIAGFTGTGKSTFLWNIFRTLTCCLPSDEIKFLIIDAKKCEFSCLENNKCLIETVVTSPADAVRVLKNILALIGQRETLFSEQGFRDINAYNKSNSTTLERIVIMIDELADLIIYDSEIEELIMRIAMRGRQAGVHLIVATAFSMEHILTSLILCNIPSRIAFKVNNKKDSMRLIGTSEAVMLEAKGDMLYYPVTRERAYRLQGVYIDK